MAAGQRQVCAGNTRTLSPHARWMDSTRVRGTVENEEQIFHISFDISHLPFLLRFVMIRVISWIVCFAWEIKDDPRNNTNSHEQIPIANEKCQMIYGKSNPLVTGDICHHLTSNSSIPASFQPPPTRARINTAVPDSSRPSCL